MAEGDPIRPLTDPETSREHHDESEAPRRAGPAGSPRLGIIHFLLWMAASALMMGMYRDFASSAYEPTVEYALRQAIFLTESMVYGAALASLSLFYFYRRRRLVFPSQPGHWLLLLLAASILLNRITSLFDPTEDEFLFQDTSRWILLRLTIRVSIPSLILLVAGMVLIFDRSIVWGVVMLSCLLVVLVDYLIWIVFTLDMTISGTDFSNFWFDFPILRILTYAKIAVPALGIAVACLVDFLQRIRRDWAHWLGVGCRLLTVATLWLWQSWTQLQFQLQ